MILSMDTGRPSIAKLVESEASHVGIHKARLVVAKGIWTRLEKAERKAMSASGVNIAEGQLPDWSHWEALSIKDLWEAFVGPATDEFVSQMGAYFMQAQMFGVMEAGLSSSAFHILTGNIIQRAVLSGYSITDGLIGNALVTALPSRLKEETLSGVQAIEIPQDVGELEPYPWVRFDEKAVRAPEPVKQGMRLGISREMVLFDQTGRLQQQSRQLGQAMQYHREEQILKTVADATGFQRYYPKKDSGSFAQENLFRTSGSEDTTTWYKRHITSIINPLVDYRNLTVGMENFADRTDEQARKFTTLPRVLMVPFGLFQEALAAVGATQVRSRDNPAAATRDFQQISPAFTSQILGVQPAVLQSAILSGISTTNWYMGDPKQSLFEQTHWATEIVPGPANDDDSHGRDLVAKFKVSRKQAVTVATDAFWLRNTAS